MNFDSFELNEKRQTTFKDWAECRELKAEMFAYCEANPERQFEIGKDDYRASPKQFYWVRRAR